MDQINREKAFLIIKMKDYANNLDQFRDYLIKSLDPKESKAYYNLTERSPVAHQTLFNQMKDGVIYYCALLDYTNEKISCLYWAECHKYSKDSRNAIHCRLLYMTKSEEFIENFVYSLQLDLEKDFEEGAYINYEVSPLLLEQMHKFAMQPYQFEAKKETYQEIVTENQLSPLAQKNQYCKRMYNLRSPDGRGEFQRDYDRIVYSKAYRRMVDKAQIFSSVKGDHYRTRMTHTLVVCQIARNICNALGLNSNLAEAIAAGHDLGHTPFGHQGERTLHAILTGEEGFEVDNLALIGTDKGNRYPFGGFKHNYQSVRVATMLESQYLEIDGLDLSEQTLNGMWMHTGKKSGIDICDFSNGFLEDNDSFAFTLEGQVVAAADEIAQRSHDIDDAFASHLITLDDFSKYMELRKSLEIKKQIDELASEWQKLKLKNRLFVDENELVCTRISSIIVNYFIHDICEETQKNMEKYNVNKFRSDGHKVNEKLVKFSDKGDCLCKYLDNLITKKVINSREVTLFDQNGSSVVLALFKAYYKNPMLLHTGTLKRIWNEYRKNELETIDFKEGKPSIVKSSWKEITTAPIPSNIEERTPEQEVLLKKRCILVRAICDFISGMTDSYAMNEYGKIIGT